MAQQLRAYIVFPEEPSSVPSTHTRWLTSVAPPPWESVTFGLFMGLQSWAHTPIPQTYTRWLKSKYYLRTCPILPSVETRELDGLAPFLAGGWELPYREPRQGQKASMDSSSSALSPSFLPHLETYNQKLRVLSGSNGADCINGPARTSFTVCDGSKMATHSSRQEPGAGAEQRSRRSCLPACSACFFTATRTTGPGLESPTSITN